MGFFLPSARATAKNGIWSITVLRRTGPLWLSLGLFQTTRFTPDFLITLQTIIHNKCVILIFQEKKAISIAGVSIERCFANELQL